MNINIRERKQMQGGSITWSVEIISPEVAKAYLARNVVNRKLNVQNVREMAQMMRDGKWAMTHQGIAFDSLGNLNDGQHRLNAVVEAGVPVQMHVCRGVDPMSMAFVDCGRVRSTADAAVLIGMDWVDNSVVAVARKMWEGMLTSARINRSDLLEFIAKHKDALIFARCKSRNGALLAAVARAYYLRAPRCPSITREKLHRFMHVISTGVSDGEKESAAIVLRNWMSTHNMAAGGSGLRQLVYQMTENNLVAFINEEPRKSCCKTDREQFFLPEESDDADEVPA